MYRYLAELIRVVDGDTIDFKVDLGFKITQEMRVRLNAIDTPEIRGAAKIAGIQAKQFVEAELRGARIIAIQTYKVGHFGRYLSDVYYSARTVKPHNMFKKKYSLNQKLVEAGYATKF
jgi:micrococcal nuclease